MIKFRIMFVCVMNLILYSAAWLIFWIFNSFVAFFDGSSFLTLDGAYFIGLNVYLFFETYKCEKEA